jgi:hypothetical protein
VTPERTFLQTLAGEAVDFLEFAGGAVGDDAAKDAILRDLGGNPSVAPTGEPLPAAKLDAVRAYAASTNPTATAGASALADIVTLLDAIASNIEIWSEAFPLLAEGDGDAEVAMGEELAQSLLDLLATNYVRLRWPRLFFILQAALAIDEIGSTYGSGAGSSVRIWSALKTVGLFLWLPGRTVADLDPDIAEGEPQVADRLVDFGFRIGSVAGGYLDGFLDWKLFDDWLYGWDARGLDVDSPERPAVADVISSRMTSLSIVRERDRLRAPSDRERVQLSFVYVPKAEGGRSLVFAVGGSLDFEAPVGDRWTYNLKVRADAGITARLGDPSYAVEGPEASAFQLSGAVTSRATESTGLSFAIPAPTGTRLEIGQLALAIMADKTALETTLKFASSALVVDASDNDPLIRDLLGGAPLRLPFEIVVGYSSLRGLILEGRLTSAGSPATGQPNAPLAGGSTIGAPVIAATIPMGRVYGPVTIHEVGLRAAIGPPERPLDETNVLSIAADVSFSAQLGPAYLRLDQLGLSLLLDASLPREERNLRVVDGHLGVKAPLGIAVQVDSDLVTGGGTIHHDPAEGTYFGVLVLKLKSGLMIKAIGLVSTRLPDGTEGSSIIVLATIENLNWSLGPSITVDGLGILVGVNRTFDEAAMRTALPTGQLRHLLFPVDPVHHTTEIMRNLATFFPARRGSHMIGLLVKLAFGRPKLVNLDLALIYAWGDRRRLIVLGRVWAILPVEEVGVVRLNLDAVGVIDFTAGTVAVDAVLVDSKLCDRFPLTGAAALRGGQGTGGFALAVGGLHPRFTPPPGFPALSRITLALSTGDNPKLICQAYVAITSNTLQFGASAFLYAAACGFSIEGSVGFDVLIQRLPFHYLAEFRASVQLKRGSHNLFKVSVDGALEGPLPLRVRGKATFEIFWWDYSVRFDRTLVGGATPSDAPTIDALGELMRELGDGNNWRAQSPGEAGQLVSVRADVRPGVLLHPMGALTVRQGVVPLNLTRDIDRVGAATPSGVRRFAVTKVKLGDDELARDDIRDLFAPAQFFDMTDDDKLAAPSFEEMDAGVTFGSGEYAFDPGSRANSPFDYTDITIGPDGTPSVEPEPHRPSAASILIMLRVGAAARSPVRRTLTSRFEAPVSDAAPRLPRLGWTAVDVGGTTVPAATTTWAEAQAQLRARGPARDRVLVPKTELVG